MIERFRFHDDDALMFALVVERPVLADGEEPGGESLGIQRGDVLTEFEEHVLHHVAGLFEVVGVAVSIPDQRSLIALQSIEKKVVRVVHESVFVEHDDGPFRFLGRGQE